MEIVSLQRYVVGLLTEPLNGPSVSTLVSSFSLQQRFYSALLNPAGSS